MRLKSRFPYLFELLVIIVAATVGISLLGDSSKNEGALSDSKNNYQKEITVLSEMFANEGLEKTMEFFREEVAEKYDAATIHNIEHFLGKELYSIRGRDGISLCPYDSLLSGCYHGFFNEASLKEGGEFIDLAESGCKIENDFFKASGCLHGVGHGFLSMEGRNNLLPALKNCDLISYSIPFGNEMCYTGVFMEYNELRETAEREELYEPCRSIPQPYQPACYLQLAQWWGEISGNNFSKMGTLCSDISRDESRDNCFRSIGMVVLRASRNTNQIRDFCQKMPSKRSFFLCTTEAAKLSFILKQPESLDICNFLGTQYSLECREDIQNFLCQNLLQCNQNEDSA